MAGETRSNTLAVPAESGRNRITLEPLREQGPDAITAAGIPEIKATTLRELHTICDNLDCDSYIRVADDLFADGSADDGYHDLFPRACSITKAVLDFYFAGSAKPRSVTLSPRDNIITQNPSDAEIVQQWAMLHGFVTSIESARRCAPGEQTVAVA
jgi:hypothetical protein